MNKMPQIREYMTRVPLTVDSRATLSQIRDLMRQCEVRHLPVKQEGKLVGIISDRAVKSALAVGTPLTAEDLMIKEPFTVASHTLMDEVLSEMAEEKYGCALIEEEGKLVGIFTTVDACRTLRQFFQNAHGGHGCRKHG